MVQNTSGARVSAPAAFSLKLPRANSPTAPITSAVVTSIAAASPSARSAMPSGGAQPPRK